MKLPAMFSKKLSAAAIMPLAQWIWRDYCKRILLPLLCMQLLLIGLYFLTQAIQHQQHVATLNELAAAEAELRTQIEAKNINQQLAAIAQSATFLQSYTADLIQQQDEAHDPLQKAYLSAALAPVYHGIEQSNPHIAQVYFSTDDVLNHSRSYRQMQTGYKQAPVSQTPGRAVAWTAIEQNKSSQGWMSSAQAAVYSDQQRQGVVGIDVMLDGLLSAVVDVNTAGQSYAMLLDQDGKVVAIPPRGLPHWGEVAAHRPTGTGKMQLQTVALTVNDHASTLLAKINGHESGASRADIGGMHLVSWALITQTGWKLVVTAPALPPAAISNWSGQHSRSSWWLACALLGLNLGFILVLYYQARKMSQSLSAPLARINQMVSTITAGQDQRPLAALAQPILPLADFVTAEFNQAAQGVVLMGLLLDVASKSRQQAEAELDQRNRQLQSVFDLSPDGLILTDGHGQVVLVNPALCQMTGLNPAEYLFKSDQLLWQKLVQLSTTPDLVPGSPPASFRLELETPQQCVLQCQILNMNQQDSATAVKLIHLRDITRDAAVDQMKSEFITTAAHELRTPLTSVLGYSELLMKDMIPAEMRTEAFSIVVSKTKLVINIINEMLDLARIEARHGLDFNIKPYPADELVKEVLASYPLPALRSPIVSTSLADLWVNVDQDKFKAALTNLLDNAYKYSSSGDVQLQVISDNAQNTMVDSLPAKPRVGFRVQDAGIGMSTQQSQHAFDRFWRADASGNIPGTGLGLAIVKEVMRILGGSVDIESAPGKGTTVTLWLAAVDGTHAIKR
jgi:signal transduction histidine kinase